MAFFAKSLSRMILAAIVFINLALHIVRIAIASRNRNEIWASGSISDNANWMTETALISALIGVAACWMAISHIIRWRQSTHDATHALDILAFIFNLYALGYASKFIYVDNTGARYTALAVLTIIQAFTHLVQMVSVFMLRDGFNVPVQSVAGGPASAQKVTV